MKEVLITSSVLIGVILLARWLFRGKVSQKLIYAAWLLVAIRLLVPIQFGQFQYSVTTLTEKIESQSKPIQQAQEALKAPVAGPSRAELYQQLLNEYIQQDTNHALPDVQPQITPDVQEQLEVQAEQLAAPSLSEVLTAIWIVGMSAMSGWFFTANFIFLRRAKKGAVPFTEMEAPVQIRISPNVPTPCLVGLFRPVIYLTPASIENEQSRNHVLAHELTHLRHVDHIWALVRCVCLCIYWFNPLVWLAASQSRRDCELACDESALKKLGDEQRIAYGHTLLSTVAQSISPVHLLEAATAMNETKKQLKERVCFIVKKPRNIMTAMICMVLVTAIATGCTFAGGKATEPERTTPTTTEPVTSTKPTESIPSTGATEPTPSTPPTTDPPSPYDPTNGTPAQTLSAEEVQALQTAENLIDRYMWYKAVGVCCKFEQINRDLSQFLTTEQKKEYVGYQYHLKCCHTAQDVRAHIDRFLAPSVLRGYPDDLLFNDDQSNLYLIVTPTEYDGYRHIKLEEYSNNRIVASACIFDEDGCWCSETFTMERKGDHFAITRILRNDTVPEAPSNVPPMSSADYHYDTITLAKERFGLTYVEFLYVGNKAVQSFLPEQTAPDTLAMYQHILFIDHDNTVRMHFPVFSSGHTSYHVAEFTVPEGDNLLANAYQWFFDELGQTVDGADANAYAYMMTDSLFQDPDLFIRNLSQCSDDTVSDAASLIFNSLAPDEANVYKQLLDYLIKQYIASDLYGSKELKTVRILHQPFANNEEDDTPDQPTEPDHPSEPDHPNEFAGPVAYLPITVYQYTHDTLTGYTTYAYNQAGRLLSKKFHCPSDSFFNYSDTYTYNEHGDLTSYTHSVPEQGVYDTAFYTYTYNEDSSVCTYTGFTMGTHQLPVYYFQYNDQGKLLKIVREFKNGTREDYVVCTYTEHGQLETVTKNFYDGVFEQNTYTYYDDGTLWKINSIYYNGTHYQFLGSDIYKYDMNGSLASATVDRTDGDIIWTYHYTNGTLSKLTYLSKAHTPNSGREYTIDANGNIATVKYSDGKSQKYVYQAFAVSEDEHLRMLSYWNQSNAPTNLAYCEDILLDYLPRHLS